MYTVDARNPKHMSNTKTKTAKPVTDGISGKIAVLERRAEYLKGKLDRPGYATTSGADFDRTELTAITSAVECMRYVANA